MALSYPVNMFLHFIKEKAIDRLLESRFLTDHPEEVYHRKEPAWEEVMKNWQ